MVLYEKLTLLREERGLTQEELAEELNVSRQAVSRWETGASFPSTENLGYLSQFFQVTVDYLLNDSAELPKEEPPKEEQVPISMEEEKSEKAGKENARVTWLWIAAAVLILTIGLSVGFFIGRANKEQEYHIEIGKIQGEEVDFSSAETFGLQTGW